MPRYFLSRVRRVLAAIPSVVGGLLIFLAFTNKANAFIPEGPEIDPGSMVSALALLAGASMLISDKLRRK